MEVLSSDSRGDSPVFWPVVSRDFSPDGPAFSSAAKPSRLSGFYQLQADRQRARRTFRQRLQRVAVVAVAVGLALSLVGCYVVPIHPQQQPTYQAHGPVVYAPAPPPAPPMPVTFAARLYPANELAQTFGMVGAVVTNDLNGRGTFSTTINGETFNGEATRTSGASREGIANGAGNRGGFINCTYRMNSNTLGSGQCKLSNGAQFTMHVGG
jgi:hypothetical protein